MLCALRSLTGFCSSLKVSEDFQNILFFFSKIWVHKLLQRVLFVKISLYLPDNTAWPFAENQYPVAQHQSLLDIMGDKEYRGVQIAPDR